MLVAASAVAQTASVPQSAQLSDPLSGARDDLQKASAQLAKAKLDIVTEPAFRFKA